eukprot:TRINITY_DN67668_c9_g1_i2.p4 TRINITY_DN67668_c9_g1~~TRINITY_DN67668_c9_g1_i2.p4  ORF type:complete len:108 (-),score=20.26 TRINITY_DN67668_c9_g1_i2:685-1008(-)
MTFYSGNDFEKWVIATLNKIMTAWLDLDDGEYDERSPDEPVDGHQDEQYVQEDEPDGDQQEVEDDQDEHEEGDEYDEYWLDYEASQDQDGHADQNVEMNAMNNACHV